MAKFTLKSTAQVQGEGRMEDAYTYVNEDGTQELVWRWHSTKAFKPIVISQKGMNVKQMTALIDKHVEMGTRQDEFTGGFDEAIKTLEVK